MPTRITMAQVERKLEHFCAVAGFPYNATEPGGLYLDGAYDGYRVEQIQPSGGSMPVWSDGYDPLRSVFGEIDAAIKTLSLLRKGDKLKINPTEE